MRDREALAMLVNLAPRPDMAALAPEASPPVAPLRTTDWTTNGTHVQAEREVSYALPAGRRDHLNGFDRAHRGPDPAAPIRLAPPQATPGALNDSYHLPRVKASSRAVPSLIALTVLLVAARAGWHLGFAFLHRSYWLLLPLWTLTFGIPVASVFLCWFDTPFITTERQDRQLDELFVAVAVPVYNEDPELLDRCIYSLVNSSRPPQKIHVVEDGPSGDYTAVRDYWIGHPCVAWTRCPVNGGKKHAQSVAFVSCPEADIFLTVDSDTALEHRAIEEGLKPFADRGVASVAMIEEVYNKDVNWLTRTCTIRNTVSQLTAWSTQSVFGDVLINRGTGALYRAENIRPIIPAYVGETFLGHPIKLGDDSALTLFSMAHGRTVQQVTAFCLPMYPEKLSHHFRQWLRWARGGTVRNFWRLRYLPILSWGWWWVALGLYFIFTSVIIPFAIVLDWPKSEAVACYIILFMMTWAAALGPRCLCVRRSGESRFYRFVSVLLYPFGVFWTYVVLRPVRIYGVVSCLKQGWVTRQKGVEVEAHEHDHQESEARVYAAAH
jgi:hyaluronan synthase